MSVKTPTYSIQNV